MFLRLIGCLVACLLVCKVSAQQVITVHVHDKDKGDALDFAYVNAYNVGSDALVSSQITDQNGNAELDIKKYPVRLEIQAIGFEPTQLTIEAPADAPVDIPLSKRFAALNEVVVTGNAAPTKLQDALSTYQVITKATMVAQGAVNLGDALKNQLNINIGNDNILGSNIRMQGLGGDKVKILVDGLPLNGREAGNIDLGQINLNNVERIEIVQGPMSVVYGTDALGGVINVITRKDKLPWQFQAGTYFETIGKYNVDLSGTYNIKNRHQISLGGARNFFQGWGPTDPLERSFLWNPKEQYIVNLAYNYSAKQSPFRLQFASDFIKEKITDKDAHYVINPWKAQASDNYYRDTRLNTRLLLSGKLGKTGAWRSDNSYAIYYRTKNEYTVDMTTMNKELSDDTSAQDTTRFDDVTLRGSYSNEIRRISFTAGYDLTFESAISGKLDSNAKGIQDYGLYANAGIPVWKDKLTFQPAIRFTYNSRFGAPLIPSVNVLYKASDVLQFRVSYGKGFRAPSLKELYLKFNDANHNILGNTQLKAETGDHLQLSTSWTAYQKQSDFARLLLTIFYNDVDNQIVLFQPDPVNNPTDATYKNIIRITNLIGSLQAEAQWENVYAQAGFSLTHILNMDTLVNAAQASLTLQYFWKKPAVNISTFVKYSGRQPNPSSSIVPEHAFDGVQGDYTFWDASVEKRLFDKKLQVTLGVKNILDVQTIKVNGASISSIGQAHSGGADGLNLSTGRSLFLSLRLTLQ